MLFLLFLVIALVLRLLPGTYRDPLAEGVRGTLLRPVLSLQRGSLESEVLLADPTRLRAERDSLAAFLVGHSTLETENRQLRTLLGLRQRLPPSFVPAEVVRVPERGFGGAFLLTAGRADSVRAGSPIVAAGGLVGVVREADARVSLGIDWTHTDFRASAMTLDGETFGIVEPRESSDGEQLLALTGTALHAELPEGTLVVTSGRGGVYPRGIPIGTVIDAEDTEVGWRKSYLIRPLVSPAEMTHVLVLGDAEAAPDQDLALSWGIRPPPPPPVDTTQPALLAPVPGSTPSTPTTGAPATAAPAPAAPAPAAPRPAATPRPNTGPELLGRPVQRDTPAGGPPREERR